MPKQYSARADYETPAASESLRAGMSPRRWIAAYGKQVLASAECAANSRGLQATTANSTIVLGKAV